MADTIAFEDSISPTEVEALERFRCLIDQNGWNCPGRDDEDQFLLKFLRARQLDVNRAGQMYAACLRWRSDNSLASILQDFTYPELSKVLQAWPQTWHKTDKLGRPINIQFFSRLDVGALFQATTEERLLRRALWVLEHVHEVVLPACSKAVGHYVGRVTVIVDLRNVGIGTLTNARVRRFLITMARVFSQYYPEYLGRLFIVNAPASFKLVWQLLSPFMDDKTRNKIRIHRSEGTDDLLSCIEAENLPASLGGRCSCESCASTTTATTTTATGTSSR